MLEILDLEKGRAWEGKRVNVKAAIVIAVVLRREHNKRCKC